MIYSVVVRFLEWTDVFYDVGRHHGDCGAEFRSSSIVLFCI